MTSSAGVLVAAVLLASAVEMVEALTIVMAVGTTTGWRAALKGAGLALLVLTAATAALGPSLLRYLPLSVLRVVVGGFLLAFGLQWLRKAVLRTAGYKAKHDEDAIYDREVAELSRRAAASPNRQEHMGTVVAFKGVLLEGLEVVVIVVSLGSTAHDLLLAAGAALAALAAVGTAGLLAARHLSSVPENAMKSVVGVMLVSFGTFWAGEGLGVRWPGGDVALLALVAFYALTSFGLGRLLAADRRRHRLGRSDDAAAVAP